MQTISPLAYSGHSRVPGTSFEDLVRVDRGTPMGELLRRYWQPVALSRDATQTPRRIRVLGEDLVMFRDGGGRPGLMYPHCVHRGADLYYGKVEEDGIRCCYHGWKFDRSGTCLDQPCEPRGAAERSKARQPSYPLTERHGMIFAYMGPPERLPSFPVFAFLEQLTDAEEVAADDTSIGSGGGTIVPCSWLHALDNVCDPYHVPILHDLISGLQFTDVLSGMPSCEFALTARGVRVTQDRQRPDGTMFRRVTEAMLPNIRLIPSPRPASFEPCNKVGWIVPIDDTTHRIFTLARVPRGAVPAQLYRQAFEGRGWHELTEAEHQRMPGDFEAQVGQGPIARHSEEHLATSDRGVVLLRRHLRAQLAALAEGKDPINVSLNGSETLFQVEAGNFLLQAV